jgi:hypothetical protein
MYYTDYFGYHLFTIKGAYGAVLLKNAEALLTSLGGLLLGWAAEPGIAERLTAVVMMAGTIRHCRRIGLTPYHLFTAGYIVLLLVWHYPPDERFLLPVLPVFLAGLWSELRLGYELLARSSRAAGVVFAAAASLFLLYWSATGWTMFSASLIDFRHLRTGCQPAYAWIARNTPAGAGFLASEDALLYLYTGRPAMTLIVPMRHFYEGDREGVVRLTLSRPSVAREHGLEYIFDAPRDWWRELLPNSRALSRESREALARSGEARQIYASNGCAVYRALAR